LPKVRHVAAFGAKLPQALGACHHCHDLPVHGKDITASAFAQITALHTHATGSTIAAVTSAAAAAATTAAAVASFGKASFEVKVQVTLVRIRGVGRGGSEVRTPCNYSSGRGGGEKAEAKKNTEGTGNNTAVDIPSG
jgi:hypothetical protein